MTDPEKTKSMNQPTTLQDVVSNRQTYLARIVGIDQSGPLKRPNEIRSDSEAQQNYRWAALVAFNMRLADTPQYSDPAFLEKAKRVLERNPRLGFYVAYLWATDSVEMAEEFELELPTATSETREFMVDRVVHGITSGSSEGDISMINDIMQRGVEYIDMTGSVRGQFDLANLNKIAAKYASSRGDRPTVSLGEVNLRRSIATLARAKK